MLRHYIVMWSIDVFEAESPLDAARQAREAQTRLDTSAIVFDVVDEEGNNVQVDLEEELFKG